MLENVGVIAGMKGVAVAQHGRKRRGGRRECCIFCRVSSPGERIRPLDSRSAVNQIIDPAN
jgi:hypothetical protein